MILKMPVVNKLLAGISSPSKRLSNPNIEDILNEGFSSL
jgi:hypothetical protein